MSQQTFQLICRRLKDVVGKQDTNMRKSIPHEKRVALTIWALGSSVEYRTLAHLFGVSKASVSSIMKEVCKAIVDVLSDEYIYLPSGEELHKIMFEFEKKWGFPQCAGGIDGSHIAILPPRESQSDFYNRKGWHSIILQGVADCNYIFRDVCVGWPGRVHDARVLTNSNLYIKAQGGTLFSNGSKKISGIDVPPVLLGDPAYPLEKWLMKPYRVTDTMPQEQKYFNYVLSRSRMVIENAFGRLKGRWRRLGKRIDMSVSDVPVVVLASCTLHNICEMQKEEYLLEWDHHREAAGNVTDVIWDRRDVESHDSSSHAIRDAICSYLT